MLSFHQCDGETKQSTGRSEMATRTVYRVQPVGLDIDHQSLTSNDTLDCGVHVCCSLEELAGCVNGWCRQQYIPEVIAIECDAADVRDNGDYEGFVLRGNRGVITKRTRYENWDTFAALCRDYSI